MDKKDDSYHEHPMNVSLEHGKKTSISGRIEVKGTGENADDKNNLNHEGIDGD